MPFSKLTTVLAILVAWLTTLPVGALAAASAYQALRALGMH